MESTIRKDIGTTENCMRREGMMIGICIRCGKKYTYAPGSEAEKDGLCGICFRVEKARMFQTTTQIINNSDQHKKAPSQPTTFDTRMTLNHQAMPNRPIKSSQPISPTPIGVSTRKYQERPLTFYTEVLEKFDVSDCLTFEEVKKKFPDRDPAFLRKLLHLKGMKISEYEMLEKRTEKVTESQSTPFGSERERQTPQTKSLDDSPSGSVPQLLADHYRLHLDLKELPRMRIGAEHPGIEQPEREFEEKGATEWPEADDFEEDKGETIRNVYPHRRYVWWTIEDRKPFSYYEMQQELEDYCEECGNFGPLLYCDGLFLCEICQHTSANGYTV